MTTDEETRHGQFHADTKRVMVTFRGSSPADQELYSRLQVAMEANGDKFSQVVRAELWRYVRRHKR